MCKQTRTSEAIEKLSEEKKVSDEVTEGNFYSAALATTAFKAL